ncbi:hypothetical protein PQO01_15210 [Lentisphaera marina]|nr:hypothetical protein [Lentisphaera marina]MDD7986298.1 hypothetical protein [Lentisphaera marina]
MDSGTVHMNGAEGHSAFSEKESKLTYKLKHLAIIGNWHRLKDISRKDLLHFKITDPSKAKDLQINLELKGDGGVQHFPLSSESQDILIQWDLLGNLNEIVLLVSNTNQDTVSGELDYSFELKDFPVLEKKESFSIAESGALNINSAISILEEDRLKFALAPGDICGVWAKGFELQDMDILEFNLFPELNPKLQYSIEIKGEHSTEIVQVLRTSTRTVLDHNKLGKINELVLLIENASSHHLSDQLSFQLQSTKMTFLEKVNQDQILALLLILVCALVFSQFFTKRSLIKVNNWHRSFAISLYLCLILLVYSLSNTSSLERSFYPLLTLLCAVSLSILISIIASSKLPSRCEVFTHFSILGIIITFISTSPVWSMPNSFSDLPYSGGFGTILFLTLYFGVCYLRSIKKSLPLVSFYGLALLPCFISLLLLMQNNAFLNELISLKFISIQVIAENLGLITSRFLILFFFVEFICQFFSFIINKHALFDKNAHKKLAYLSLAIVLSPYVADLGCAPYLSDLPRLIQAVIAVITTIFSQGMLWAFVFMITGVLLDAINGIGPAAHTIHDHAFKGRHNGRVYSGVLMAILQLVGILCEWNLSRQLFESSPIISLSLLMIFVFPAIKVIIESFDGSHGFFARTKSAYKEGHLFTRGALVGLSLGLAIQWNLSSQHTFLRALFGFVAGTAIFAGINALKEKSAKSFLINALQGGFIGAALAFYFDAGQVPVVAERFFNYNTFATSAQNYSFDTLLSKWGHVQLGTYTGGSKLFFNQALNGVIAWGVAAWLFALNQSLLKAIFTRNSIHLKRIVSQDGLTELAEGTIRVLRWGLWMSPIIFTFLRQMPDPTWYNQDGAIHTLFCIGASFTMTAEQFHSWSLEIFMWIMAYEAFRILIWLDHMGLRVATLVNLSFIGMDDLDKKFARFTGKEGSSVIPEGVKRFMTWAPLLIPYYIPRSGADWDYAWNKALSIQANNQNFNSLKLAILAGVFIAVLLVIQIYLTIRKNREKYALQLSKQELHLSCKNGHISSTMHGLRSNIQITRSDKLNENSQVFILRHQNKSFNLFKDAKVRKEMDSLIFDLETAEFNAEVTVTIPVKSDPVYFIDLKIQNLKKADVELILYQEWSLDKAKEDQVRVQEKRESQEILLSPGSNALYCLQPTTGMMGLLASQAAPDAYLRHRTDFKETSLMKELPKTQRHWHPDPATGLILNFSLNNQEQYKNRFIMGCAFYEDEAKNFVKSYLLPNTRKSL